MRFHSRIRTRDRVLEPNGAPERLGSTRRTSTVQSLRVLGPEADLGEHGSKSGGFELLMQVLKEDVPPQPDDSRTVCR